MLIWRRTALGQLEAVFVGVEAYRPTDSSGVEVEEVAELGGAGEDEVGCQEGRNDIVLGVEGEIVNGGVFGAERGLCGGESGLEDGEGRSLWEVMEDTLVGDCDGDHEGDRFFPAGATFFGAGCAKVSR